MDLLGISALVIGLVAFGVAGWQMYMSRSRHKELKKNHDDLKENVQTTLDHIHREFGLRLKGSTKFNPMGATVEVGKRKAINPTFLLRLRRLLGKLLS